jgi:hypothetical protein
MPAKQPAEDLGGLPEPVSTELFQPVSSAPRRPLRGAVVGSTAEKQRRRVRKQANRADFDPHAAVDAALAKLRASARPIRQGPLSLDAQIRMASTLSRQFYREAKGQTKDGTRLTPNGRKQAAVAWGVATDKLAMLQNRPPLPPHAEDQDARRPAVLELGQKLAALSQAPKP